MKSRSKDFIELAAFLLLGLAAVVGFAACGVYFDHKYGYDVQKVQVVAPQTAQVASVTTVPAKTAPLPSKPAKPHKKRKTAKMPDDCILTFDGDHWVFSRAHDGTPCGELPSPLGLGGDITGSPITGTTLPREHFTPPPAPDNLGDI
jgi:hypothetical protein